MENYYTTTIEEPDPRHERKVRKSMGLESGVGYHSQSSTKISDANQFRRPLLAKNLSETYGLSD